MPGWVLAGLLERTLAAPLPLARHVAARSRVQVDSVLTQHDRHLRSPHRDDWALTRQARWLLGQRPVPLGLAVEWAM